MATARVVLLILTWNRRDDVLRCVASLSRLRDPSVTPVVVDNASQDDTLAALTASHPDVMVIRNAANLGYAGGNNVGIRWALARGADYVLLINSDTEVTAELVGELVRVAESDPRIAVAGARNLLLEDPTRLWGAYDTLTYGPFAVRSDGAGQPDGPAWRDTRDVDVAIGNGYLWRRAALEQIGLLDESLFGYHEDVDWCLRARRAGWRVVYAGAAAILHRGGSSSAPGAARVFPQAYFLGRNGVRIAQRYGRPVERLRFAAACLGAWAFRAGRALLRRDAGDLARERTYLRGAVDAWRGRPIPFADLGMKDVKET